MIVPAVTVCFLSCRKLMLHVDAVLGECEVKLIYNGSFHGRVAFKLLKMEIYIMYKAWHLSNRYSFSALHTYCTYISIFLLQY